MNITKIHCMYCGVAIEIRMPSDNHDEWSSMIRCLNCENHMMSWRTSDGFVTLRAQLVVETQKQASGRKL